jgi:hypothetical protein
MIDDSLDRFIDAFILRERKERWRILLGSPKGRKRLVRTFAHGYDFDPRWATKLGPIATVDSILALLKSKGAGTTCFVLSEDSSIDGAIFLLDEAIQAVLHAGFGTYLICDPGRLAYFESEDVGGNYLLER